MLLSFIVVNDMAVTTAQPLQAVPNYMALEHERLSLTVVPPPPLSLVDHWSKFPLHRSHNPLLPRLKQHVVLFSPNSAAIRMKDRTAILLIRPKGLGIHSFREGREDAGRERRESESDWCSEKDAGSLSMKFPVFYIIIILISDERDETTKVSKPVVAEYLFSTYAGKQSHSGTSRGDSGNSPFSGSFSVAAARHLIFRQMPI